MRNNKRRRSVAEIMNHMKASAEQLQARLGLRSSSAAQRHKNLKKFHKADRKAWKREI